MLNQPAYTYTKENQLKNNRTKLTRHQRSNLTPKEDKRLKARSNDVCEKCDRQRATQRAHLERRWKSESRPTAEDYAHLCGPCHDWADETPQGRKWLKSFKRKLRGEAV
jgi:hypothetical protein